MKKNMCPMCWNTYIKHIENAKVDNQKKTKSLLFCQTCEKYYWGDTKESVSGLSTFCKTHSTQPEKCYIEEEKRLMAKGRYSLKQKVQMSDLLCGFCPSRKLVISSDLVSSSKPDTTAVNQGL